jgi:predicted transposase/invertase (TIGR01784 family)
MVYSDIKPTITICLLAFDLLGEEEAYRNSFSIRNDKSGNRLCEDMLIIYLEIPKFLRFLGERYPKNGLERWLLYFSNEEGERMELAIAEAPALLKAREMELAFWADAKEKELYYQHQRLLMDAYSAEHTFDRLLKRAEEKADQLVAQAEAKAAQAEEKAAQAKEETEQVKEQIALNLLKEGFDVEMVAKISSLPREKVEELR